MVQISRDRVSKTERHVRAAWDDDRPTHAVLLGTGTGDKHARVLDGQARLVEPALVLGRRPFDEPDADGGWSLTDALASRRHARLERTPSGDFVLIDEDSTNGTFVDGARVRGSRALKPGAVITVGAHVFVFRLLGEATLEALYRTLAAPFGPVALLSPAMAAVSEKLRRLARTPLDVLLAGETGVGKDVFARALHAASGRPGQFVALNCAAVPANLVESELFGYAKGAHSTAEQSKPGLVERAQGGTLFLDEIGDMPAEAQSKLLRFLQDRTFTPLGSTKTVTMDVRVVAATHHAAAPSDGGRAGVRPDLLARLGPEPIEIPPLRDRIEDAGPLARNALSGVRPMLPEAYEALFQHRWPGNVRELEKVLATAEALSDGEPFIGLEHLPDEIARLCGDLGRDPALASARVTRPSPSRVELARLLERHQGDVACVARELGRQRTLVWRWLRREGMNPTAFRASALEDEASSSGRD